MVVVCLTASAVLVGVIVIVVAERVGRPSNAPPNAEAVYTVSGRWIMRDGRTFLPDGVTVYGLAGRGWRSREPGDLAQIRASARFWHANTVRIQIAPPTLDEGAPGYLAAIETEVDAAQDSDLNVILSAQYERLRDHTPSGPNSSTVRFWMKLAPLYSRDDRVWFDLFNEPTLTSWPTWRNGRPGHVGMQTLVDDVRRVAPHNLILAEGIDKGKSLEGLGPFRLTGADIVYEVHPYFVGAGWDTPADWTNDWGDLTSSLPVLIGEWGEYEADSGECRADAAGLVPVFLKYVLAHRIGLLAWALTPGVLVTGTNLSEPTSFGPSRPFACEAGLRGGRSAGVGSDVLSLFSTFEKTNSR